MPHHDLHEPESIEDIDVIRIEDAAVWISRIFPFVQVPWLNTGDHTEVLSEVDDKFGELIAFGKAGYLYIFVADVL